MSEPKQLLDAVMSRKSYFEKNWWKRAEKASKHYDSPDNDKEAELTPFNIVYANTEILLPSLYSATPRPECVPRGKGRNEVAAAVEKLLTWLLDDNTPGKESFDCAMEGAVLSALVPGAGGVRIRHYPGDPKPICWEEFKYNQFVWGRATKWSRVPWICFIHFMRRDEIITDFKLTSEQIAKFSAKTSDDDAPDSQKPESSMICVYEIWEKTSRRVLFLCEDYEDLVLREVADDPLRLPGFFPTPGPLTLVRKPGDLNPSPLLDYYLNQAEELNRVTVRLNRVLSAIRVRGAYDSQLGDTLSKLLDASATENALVAVNRVDFQNGGFDSRIWLLPIEKLIIVAQQLYAARQQILQVIYQITGLADIVRGASVASETATAQELKSKWGTLRLRRMQRTVQTYIRDLLRLAVDGCAAVFPPVLWGEATGINLPLQAQKEQITMQYQQAAMQAQMANQPPPPPPNLPPSWEEVVAILSDDTRRPLAIDIETASTIDVDASADREEVTTFMQAFAQVMQGLAPLAQMGPQGAEAAKSMLLTVTKRFKLGREVEAALKAIPTAPPAESGEKPDASAEKEQLQLELALAREKHAVEMQKLELEKAELFQKAELARAQNAAAMRQLLQPPIPAPQPPRRPART